MGRTREDGYYIEPEEGGLGVIGYTLACRNCGRKVLVEMALIGTVHHSTPSVTCAECLKVTENFQERFPDIAESILKWAEGERET